MPRANYDPQKAHDYYERTKHLKGRKKGAGPPPPHQQSSGISPAEQKTIASIQAKLDHLRELLRQKVADTKKSESSNKDPEKKTQADKLKDAKRSKEYRDTHKQQIKNLQKGKSGGGSDSSSASKSAEGMSADELRTAIRNTVTQLKQAIADARRG